MVEDDVDYGWVMEVTFILTVVFGTPVVIIGSFWFDIGGLTERIIYTTTVAAAIWFVMAISVYTYAKLGYRST